MGLFVTFEGIDGCGKSTQINLLFKNLIEQGYNVTLTREPGGTPISEKIRNIVLGAENSNMSDRCELLLYLASRAQHVYEKILPDMLRGKVVLSDRFEEATFAYQVFGRELNIDEVLPLNSFATDGLVPDLTIVLDISVEESVKRFLASGKVRDRLELNDNDFFTRVREGYLKRVRDNPGRMLYIRGDLHVRDIENKILSEVLKVINYKKL